MSPLFLYRKPNLKTWLKIKCICDVPYFLFCPWFAKGGGLFALSIFDIANRHFSIILNLYHKAEFCLTKQCTACTVQTQQCITFPVAATCHSTEHVQAQMQAISLLLPQFSIWPYKNISVISPLSPIASFRCTTTIPDIKLQTS